MRIYSPERASHDDAADLRVGVVIPVYNRRTILLETLPSVLGQTLPPDRLIIVDDGSTDGTAAAAAAWLARQRPRFRWEVIREKHRSAAASRNAGLELVADLPLVTFLDSDDRWPADFLARGVAALRARPDAPVAVADRRFFDVDDEVLEESDCRELVRNPVEWLFHNGAGVASCTLLRTSNVVAAGGWPAHVESAEDAVLFCELALQGPWVHLPGEPVRFHLGSALARREEHNLSHRHADSHRRWAQVFEMIFTRVCSQQPSLLRGHLQRALAQRWYWAGKQMFALGEAEQARECFRRAVHWQPTMFRAWRRLAVSGAARWTGRRPARGVSRRRRGLAG